MNRQKTLLVVLGALLLVAAWRSLQPLLRGEDAVAPAAVHPKDSPGIAGNIGIRPGDRLATLRVTDLDRIPHGSAGGRDPWRFMDPLPSPSAIGPVHAPPPVLPPTDAQPPGPVVATAPAPPEISLEYLGNFGTPQRKIAVFSNGKEIYNAREGDVIGGQFIVARIGYEFVDIRFVDFPEVPARRVGVRQR